MDSFLAVSLGSLRDQHSDWPAFRARGKADFCVQPPFVRLGMAAPCLRRMGMSLAMAHRQS